MNWYVLYVKHNLEDATALQLKNASIEVLNPKLRIKKYIRGKYLRVIEPLFPGYLFANFDHETHGHMIKYTRGVKFIVGKQNPLIVPEEIIQAIRERMVGEIVSPPADDFRSGDRVLIKEGPFANFYGIFERDLPGNERAMILLETLHCKLEIESVSIRKA